MLTLPEFNSGARNREVKASDLFQSVDADGNGPLGASLLVDVEVLFAVGVGVGFGVVGGGVIAAAAA